MFPEMEPTKRRGNAPGHCEAVEAELFGLIPRFYEGQAEAVKKWKEALSPARLKSLAPDAKTDLLAAGYAKEVVEAMSPAQAVFSDMFEINEVRRDNLFKWFYVPYWQAGEEMERLESGIKTASKHAEFELLAETAVVDVQSLYFIEARIKRQLAAVRVIEAIRLYAADHGGKLPAKLEEIREVPLPINPVTGKPFAYRLDGDTAILDADGGKTQQQFRVKLMK